MIGPSSVSRPKVYALLTEIQNSVIRFLKHHNNNRVDTLSHVRSKEKTTLLLSSLLLRPMHSRFNILDSSLTER